MFNHTHYTRTLWKFEEEEQVLSALLQEHAISITNPSSTKARHLAYELLEKGRMAEEVEKLQKALRLYEEAHEAHRAYLLEMIRSLAGQLIIMARERIDSASMHSQLDRALDFLDKAQEHYLYGRKREDLSFEVRLQHYRYAAETAEKAYDHVEGYQWQDSTTRYLVIGTMIVFIVGCVRMMSCGDVPL